MKDKLLYVLPSEVHRWDLDRKESLLSGDLELSGLINGELPDSMSLYCEKPSGNGELASGGFLETKAPVEERGVEFV